MRHFVQLNEQYIYWGTNLKGALAEAMDIAQDRQPFTFRMNDFVVIIAPNSNLQLIYRDCIRAAQGCLGDKVVVGPYPTYELSEEERANDARLSEAKERHAVAYMDRARTEAMARNEQTTSLLANAPGIELSNEKLWKNLQERSTGPSRLQILAFAERWARLMQLELAKEKTIAEAWYPTSVTADFEGVAGMFLGSAVWALADTWRYGKELKHAYLNR